MTKHIVMFSGGIASWAAAVRVKEQFGAENMRLLFTDTLIEDEDLYRFLDDASAQLGVELIRLADGRTPFEVYKDVRLLGNSRIAPCSRLLKQVPARNWVKENCDPETDVLYVGIDWMEAHRIEPVRKAWLPYRVEFPLAEKPLLAKHQYMEMAREVGLKPPRLYDMGASHNNCGGFCCRAGQAQFKWLAVNFPERYAEAEYQEENIRQYLMADVSFLKDRTGGETKPLTLVQLRERMNKGDQLDMFDIGGCGCFTDTEDHS